MPLDRTKKYTELIDKILDTFSDTFGSDMILVAKGTAVEHMGFFKITYKYLPLAYDIELENDRGTFSILIYDCEGACGTWVELKNLIVEQR